jgi:translation initiation factor IF-2
MKTLTELNGTLIRKAAAAIAEAKKSLPKEAPPAPPAAEAAPAAEGAEAAPAEAAAPAPAAAPAAGPSEAVKAALEAAVAAATGLAGDRLARLLDAVEVVGGRVEDVRLVRVFGAEEPVSGAKAHNGFQYIVDMAPASMRQDWSVKKEKRFGGGGKGGGAGGKGAGSGKGAPASGGFSMDSLKDDRKGSRGPGGGGRGRPGGGSPR